MTTEELLKFTDEDIAKLKKLLTSGVKSVSYEGRSVTTRDLDELIRILQIATDSRTKRVTTVYPRFSTGRLPR